MLHAISLPPPTTPSSVFVCPQTNRSLPRAMPHNDAPPYPPYPPTAIPAATPLPQSLQPIEVSLYETNNYVIKPATAVRRCSFVEFTAPQAVAYLGGWSLSGWLPEFVRRLHLRIAFSPSASPA